MFERVSDALIEGKGRSRVRRVIDLRPGDNRYT
jgi:hypothetical protein